MNDPEPVVDPALETFPRFGAKVFNPASDRLVTLHATQARPGDEREDDMPWMAPPLAAAMVGHTLEIVRQGGHVAGAEHHLGLLLADTSLQEAGVTTAIARRA